MTAEARARRRDRDHLYYVYAVARARGGREAPPPPAPGLLPEAPVSTLGYKGLLAVVSLVPRAEFGSQTLPGKLQDLAWVRSRALAHHRVLCATAAGYTLVPLKFCTIYASAGRVREVMARHHDALGEVLDRLAGAAEMAVKAYCDRRKLLDWVWARSDALKAVRDTIARQSPGSAYLLRKNSRKKAEEEARRMIDDCVDQSHRHLARFARAATAGSNGFLGRAATGGGEVVLNAAYLVEEGDLERFRAHVGGLRERYAPRGFAHEVAGPWPPYSFAETELTDPGNERTMAR